MLGLKNATLGKLWFKDFVKSSILGSVVNGIDYKLFLFFFCAR